MGRAARRPREFNQIPHNSPPGSTDERRHRADPPERSRAASLDYILDDGGTITEAVATQVWSGDAAVHVSIANWIKREEEPVARGAGRARRGGTQRLWDEAEGDPLAFLHALNGELAEREASLKPIVGPGLPPRVDETEAAANGVGDCIEAG